MSGVSLLDMVVTCHFCGKPMAYMDLRTLSIGNGRYADSTCLVAEFKRLEVCCTRNAMKVKEPK
jgi:hypothetical protein